MAFRSGASKKLARDPRSLCAPSSRTRATGGQVIARIPRRKNGGKTRLKAECLAYIQEVWIERRPAEPAEMDARAKAGGK
jgi:hypothetical protein